MDEQTQAKKHSCQNREKNTCRAMLQQLCDVINIGQLGHHFWQVQRVYSYQYTQQVN